MLSVKAKVTLAHYIFQKSLVNRPALGVFPAADWPAKLRNVLLSVAPDKLSNVHTMMCGSCSNENAYKMVCFWYRTKERGGSIEFTEEEINSCMINQPPGSPHLSIMSFEVNIFLESLFLYSVD